METKKNKKQQKQPKRQRKPSQVFQSQDAKDNTKEMASTDSNKSYYYS